MSRPVWRLVGARRNPTTWGKYNDVYVFANGLGSSVEISVDHFWHGPPRPTLISCDPLRLPYMPSPKRRVIVDGPGLTAGTYSWGAGETKLTITVGDPA